MMMILVYHKPGDPENTVIGCESDQQLVDGVELAKRNGYRHFVLVGWDAVGWDFGYRQRMAVKLGGREFCPIRPWSEALATDRYGKAFA